MATIREGKRSVLVVVDVQVDVVREAWERARVIGNVALAVEQARAQGVPVVWVQHSDDGLEMGSDDWQIVDELSPGDGEPVVQKNYGDSFEATDLEEVLAGRGVGRVVVTGAQSDACIRATLHGALVRGYDVTLVGDAHTTEDLTEYGAPSPDLVISHTNLYWQWASAPGRQGDVVTTGEVAFTTQPG